MVFDSARADRFIPYGYEKKTTPFINELAKEGVLFENAYSQASWTLPSVISIFTGMYPDFHGARNPDGYLHDRFVPIAEYLDNNGFLTGGAYRNRWLVPKKNLNKGFSLWENTRDRLITDFGIMMLESNPVNTMKLNKFNYFADFPPSFNEERKKDWHLNQQEIWKDIIAINPQVLLSNRQIEIISVDGKFEPGNYSWGCLLKGKYRGTGVEVTLEGITVEGKKTIIDRRQKTDLNHWASLDYECRFEKEYKKITLSFRQTAKNQDPGIKLSVKRPYFISEKYLPKEKTSGSFIYLHYLAPHAPHISPGREYDPLFKDKTFPPKKIRDSAGDPNGLNYLKTELQKELIKNWAKLDNRINFHHSNYLRQLRFIDDEVKRIVTYLKKTDKYKDTLIILTSDHGEEFLEHGFVAHKMGLYNECLHIPLIMIYPNGFRGGIRIKENVASVDIYPTIIDLCGTGKDKTPLKLQKQLMGKSLLPLILGDKGNFPKRVIFSSDADLRQFSAIKGTKKLIKINSTCYDKSALFELSSDPNELRNISEKNPTSMESLQKSIGNYLERVSQYPFRNLDSRQTMDESDKNKLRGLGYLNFENGSEADPYCKIKPFTNGTGLKK